MNCKHTATRSLAAGSFARWLRTPVLIGALGLVSQACSDGGTESTGTTSSIGSASTMPPSPTTRIGNAGPTSTSVPVTSSSAPPATTTTAVQPTSTSTSAPPISSTSTSTTPETPTTVALDPDDAEVPDGYQAAFDSWTECLRALPNCELESLVATRAGSYLDAAVLQAGRYNESGQTADGLETRTTSIESVEIVSESQANVVACEVDATVRRDAAGAIVSDSFDSARVVFVMARDSGAWKVTGSEDLETGVGPEENVCAA